MKSMDESGITKGVGKHDLARGIIDSTADSSIRSMNAARSSLLGKVAKAPVTAGEQLLTRHVRLALMLVNTWFRLPPSWRIIMMRLKLEKFLPKDS